MLLSLLCGHFSINTQTVRELKVLLYIKVYLGDFIIALVAALS